MLKVNFSKTLLSVQFFLRRNHGAILVH